MPAQTLKDGIPPHDPEAEWAALGSMLLDHEAVVHAISALRPEDFYSLANGSIFRAIRNLEDQNQRADILSVKTELERLKQLDAAGGEAYIASLTSKVPTAANIDYYISVVRDKSLRRALIIIASKITAKAHDLSQESEAILSHSSQFIHELLEDRHLIQYKKFREVLTATMPILEEMIDNDITGIRSGFKDIDRVTRGFQKSEMIVIGARPSIGKTALALNMAANIAFQHRIPTAFFSLEMPAPMLGIRLLASETQISIRDVRVQIEDERSRSFNKILDTAKRIHESPLIIFDNANMDITDLRTQARYIREKEQIEIIFIDYIGLIGMGGMGGKPMQRFEQVSEISRSLKGLARELRIPIVVLSQMGREAEGEKPTIAQLRDSGSVEQDADVVMLLHRDRKADPDNPKDYFETSVDIAKNRNGETRMITLAYRPKYTRFDTYEEPR